MYCSSMHQPLKRVIVKHPEQAFISQANLNNQWRTFNYTDVPDYDKALTEYREFIRILNKHVDQIDYLPASNQTGLDSIYTHDPVKFTREGAIILKSGKTIRQAEAAEIKAYLDKQAIPIIGELTGDAVSDGGDLVWLDDRTLAVGLGYRTNQEAIRQLKKITGPFVDNFIEVPLPHDGGEDECLHLMSMISIVDQDLAVIYSPLMPVFFRQYLIEQGLTLIEVPANEYETLGCNVLALAPRVCVLPAGNEQTKLKLEQAGATVYEYDGNEISYKGTGGPTCLTCPVIRD
ncbi:dimethylarginine dimethylaminohydrolase family protein [Lentibacillus sp. CBA3610]|uniref:dimethylarginine dimethylaminohydrolase family protein n=1 Tax=Lentibacillus sp. CBA3610 TaxID=2518176 RepID=UPI001595B93D|nr:arginine deiminase family protein [Lentibacillus sp. CBA3610]QKY70171.1 amidinotransferase [Lentibacillus sp. CBA3610]